MSHTGMPFQTRPFLWQLTCVLALFAFASAATQAQTSLRVRGTITGLEGDVLSVKTREGKDLKLRLSDKTAVAAAKALKLEELKPGDYVGVTTQAKPDGALVAVEVHTIAPTVKPGHISWDLQPNTMMTNGHVEGAVAKTSAGQQLTLKYGDKTQTVVVPPGTPVVTTTPADRTALKPGEYIFTSAAVEADGTMSVQRIQVSRDGVKPPQ